MCVKLLHAKWRIESYSLFARFPWYVNHFSFVTQSKQGRLSSLYRFLWMLCPVCRNETRSCCLVKCLLREVYSFCVINLHSCSCCLLDSDVLLSSRQLVLLCLAIAYSSWYFLFLILLKLCASQSFIFSGFPVIMDYQRCNETFGYFPQRKSQFIWGVSQTIWQSTLTILGLSGKASKGTYHGKLTFSLLVTSIWVSGVTSTPQTVK